jgi:hypothetical protein
MRLLPQVGTPSADMALHSRNQGKVAKATAWRGPPEATKALLFWVLLKMTLQAVRVSAC